MGPRRPSTHAWAWVTAAFDEGTAEKAIVLAGSLRRVKTAGKMVVITSPQVPEKIRNHLYESFDLVSLLDNTETSENMMALEDQAKLFAFSLGLFNSCIFLPANSLVLKKCDEIFMDSSSLDYFIGFPKSLLVEKRSTFFAFKPSTEHFQTLRQIFSGLTGLNGVDNVFKYVLDYALNNKLEVNKLNERFYQKLSFSKDGDLFDGLMDNVAIVNFGDADPKSIRKDNPSYRIGLMESYALDLWWNIYHKEVYITRHSPATAFVKGPQQEDANDPIAVIGMSCRFPGANNLDEFWQLLIEGREGIKEIPSHRWQKLHTITTASSNCRKTNGGFLDFPIDEFDSNFFNISPKDAEFLDPQQRLLHEISWEALEDAAVDPHMLKGTNGGVFVGSWIHDYKDVAIKTADRDFFRIYMGNSLSATAARLSFFYGMTGPSIASESGCSSAILSVDLACKSLRRRETNLVIAAGVNLFLHPFSEKTMSFVLAPDGRCKTFDEKANGFGRSEGCAVLILKRLSDAIKDGDKIWGLVKGTAITQEGVSKSLGTPTIQCESLVMDLALKDAQVDPTEVSYVETHGTGTVVGDPMEIKAIEKVYSKNRMEPLVIGSVKTNLGHTEAVSGITGIMKVLLSMKNELIPPHLNFSTLNPEIDLDSIPAQIPLKALEWKRRQNAKRIAGVSSFGISGTDGHAIIEEAPYSHSKETEINLKLSRPLHFLKVSGKTSQALDHLLGQYEKLLSSEDSKNKLSFDDIAYTANTGRATFNHRAVILAKDKEEALKIMKVGSFRRKEVRGGMEAKICFLFTGQGSQYPGMAKELYNTSPVFRMAFDKCDTYLESKYRIRIRNIMWNTEQNQSLLNRTIYSQVSIFVVEYCLWRLWESWGVTPQYVLGHSLGEFASAISCGILDFESALELVVQRSLLIDCLPYGKMLVVKSDLQGVDQLLRDFYQEEKPRNRLDLAALNSSDQTVLAGDSDVVDQFFDFLSSRDVKSIVLASTHAFHSSHMDPMLEGYRKRVEKILIGARNRFSGTNINFISGMEGKLLREPEELLDPEYWVRHTREKVNFMEANRVALQEGCNIFLEVGPSPVLSAFVVSNNNEWNPNQDVVCLPSLRKKQGDWVTILDSLSKLFLVDFSNIQIDFKGFDQYYGRRKVDLPFHPFSKKKIWVNFRSTPGKVHPLVGRTIPNASKSTIFENEVTLKQITYLVDHAIGSTVIFPGAAFLEMCVVAGYCAVQGLHEVFTKPRRAITIKDLRIEAPLPLQEGKTCYLQSVVDFHEAEEDSGSGKDQVGYTVRIHNWFEDPGTSKAGTDLLGGQWKTHASSTFLPLVTDNVDPVSVNILRMKEQWEMVSAAKELYEKLPEVGLRFGPTFQSLVCGWRERSSERPQEEEKGILFEVKVPSQEDHEAYMVHPVVLDAMLQASMIWLSKERLHKKLHVPVHIQEFTWISEGKDNMERYVYCTNGRTFLLDGEGTVLASMSGIEFIETTVKLVESVIQQQSCAMPQVWEEIWKVKGGALQGRAKAAPMDEVSGNKALSSEILQTCSKLNELDDDELKVYRHLDNLTVLYFLNALHKLGWRPEVGDKIKLRDLMKQFGIAEVGWNFIKYFFNEMVTEQYVDVLGDPDDYCYIIKSLPGSKEDIEMLCEQTVVNGETSRGDYRIVSEMGKGLAEFLIGKSSPLNTLFPEDPSKPNLGTFYDTIRPWVSKTGSVLNNALSCYSHLFNTKESKNVTFRVLEIGAGTGSGTKDYLEFLDTKDVNFEYTFTDVSAAFFINAELKFEKHKDVMKYRKLDMDYDPIAQGFTPEYYDLIVACEVLHAARDIRRTLSNLRMLLKTNGHIQITETTKPDRRITLMVGLLEGYWRFTDVDLRPHHATMSSEKWITVLNQCGYKSAGSIGCYSDVHSYIYAFGSEDYSVETGHLGVFDKANILEENKYSWLIFCDGSSLSKEIQRRLQCLNRNIKVIHKTQFYSPYQYEPENGKEHVGNILKELEGDLFEGILYLWSLSPTGEDGQEQLSLPFFHLCQGVFELHKMNARLYIVTQGAYLVQDDSGCPNPQTATLWGIAKTLRNEHPEISMHCLDLSPEKDVISQVNDIFYELFWTTDGEELIAFREEKRLVPRLASVKMTDDSLKLPSFCDRYQLILPETKAISDLEFGFLNKYKISKDEIEVEIKAAALNFRDIFAVLKPTEQFDKINSIGSDFAGVVVRVGEEVKRWKVGDFVFGMNTEQQALPSHVKTKENLVLKIPAGFNFSEAATIPAVYATALYCLVNVAKIKRGDVVLIHAASGGVGLSAIQIAQHFGAEIIATAGSIRKRGYLKSLGVEKVFHSRNTDYAKEIMEVTQGRGVDIVLNSLTGPGFKEASLQVCAENARFVEMSKLNIWSEEEVQELREDVDYTIADLTTLEESEWKGLLETMMKSMKENFVKPIPYTRYEALNIRQALGYLQKAKHIGKVVCTMPQAKPGRGAEGKHGSKVKSLLFNDQSTYVITGGLGGIGLEVAKFMLDSGAKYLILVSRSSPKPEVENMIRAWNEESNKRVEAWQVDVGNYEEVKVQLLEKMKMNGWPPLRGIMHAAGVLQDGTIPNQTWEKFEKTYNAKLKGTMNLHELTKDMRLEHFVLFSSVTSLFGSPGQANHCASNAFLDAIAHYRHTIGLPATTINWANWGEIGVAADIDFPGIRPIATKQGMRALEAVLKSNKLQICVMNVDSFGMVAKLFPKVKGYVDDKRLLGDVKAPTLIINTDQFWGEVDKAEGRQDKINVFKRYIKNMLRSTLKMDPEDKIEDEAEFQGLGVDSLMLLEMKNYLQNLFGTRLMLTASHLKDCNSTVTLATRLVDMLEKRKKQGEAEETTPPSENLPDSRENVEIRDSSQPLIVV